VIYKVIVSQKKELTQTAQKSLLLFEIPLCYASTSLEKNIFIMLCCTLSATWPALKCHFTDDWL